MAEQVSNPLQYHEMLRLRTQRGRTAADIVVRQYVPRTDNVQRLDWIVLCDHDPRVCEVRWKEHDSHGVANEFLEWLIPALHPGELLQLGYTAGLTIESEPGGFRPTSLDDPNATSGDSPWLDLVGLCQFLPQGTSGSGLFPPGLPAAGEEAEWWVALDASLEIDWNAVDAVVGAHLGAIADDAWYLATRARRVATFVCAVVNAQIYGDDSDGDDAGGFNNWSVPGSANWPLLAWEVAALARSVQIAVANSSLLSRGALNALASSRAEQRRAQGARLEVTCTEASFQLLWLLRLAGIPCRELCGERVTLGGFVRSPRRSRVPLPSRLGHRIVELWDEEEASWFTVDSTRAELGPSLGNPSFVVTYRGSSGPFAPISWAYDPTVVATRTVVDGEAVDACRLMFQSDAERSAAGFGARTVGTPCECPGPARPCFTDSGTEAGDVFRRFRADLEVTEDRIHGSFEKAAYRFATWDSAQDWNGARAIRQGILQGIDAAGYFPLDLLAAAFPPPAGSICADTPGAAPPDSISWVCLILALAVPGIVVDRGFWFSRRYLALPDPCLDPVAAGNEVQRFNTSRFSAPLAIHYPVGPRSPWVWDLLAGYRYFTSVPAVVARAAAAPEVAVLSAAEIATEFMAPPPNVLAPPPPWWAAIANTRRAWLANLIEDYAAAMESRLRLLVERDGLIAPELGLSISEYGDIRAVQAAAVTPGP
jgi:hypothetical protein